MSKIAGSYDFHIGFINSWIALNLRFFSNTAEMLARKAYDMTAKQIATDKDASLKIALYCWNHYEILPNENRHVNSL